MSHPDLQLTLREAYRKHYDTSELKPATIKGYHFMLLRWEKYSGDPPVGEITNETVARWRKAVIDAGFSPAGINCNWRHYRAILRRLGPQFTGNPFGLGIIDYIPAMRPVKQRRGMPRRVRLEDVDAAYRACDVMEYPRIGVPAPDYWRCLLTVAVTTALRKSDLFHLRFDQIDLREMTIDICARKTEKEDVFPLHEVTADHLCRIWGPRERVFHGANYTGSRFYIDWHAIMRHAKIPKSRWFTLHDLRRLGGSLVDKVERGLGRVFTQHAPRDVFEISYLNAIDDLREAVVKMPLPASFRGDSDEDREQARQHAIEAAKQFQPLASPKPAEWGFRAGEVAFRGFVYRLNGYQWRLLRVLATEAKPVPRSALIDAVHSRKRATIKACVSVLRRTLRAMFGLPREFDPIPCIRASNEHQETAYQLILPPTLHREAGTNGRASA